MVTLGADPWALWEGDYGDFLLCCSSSLKLFVILDIISKDKMGMVNKGCVWDLKAHYFKMDTLIVSFAVAKRQKCPDEFLVKCQGSILDPIILNTAFSFF